MSDNAAKTHIIPDAALATFAATMMVIMLSVPITREWLGSEVAMPVVEFLGGVVDSVVLVFRALGNLVIFWR